MKNNFYLLLFLSCVQLMTAQKINTEKLNQYFDALEKNDRFMGSVSIIKDGKEIYSRATGFLDIETQKKATTQTKYRIGSISKTYTAAMVLKAVEESKLKLTDPLSNYFPGIQNAEKITIDNLLNHHSGIHNFTDDKEYLEWHKEFRNEEQMVALITKAGSDFEPGSDAQYSNSNYVLLSYILEKIYKKPYKKLLQEKIIAPLKLKDTYLGDFIDINKEEANSYLYTTKWSKTTETNTSIPLGAGGIEATPSDILKFADALFNGKILSQESLNKMKTIQGDYGYGLFQFPFGTKKLYGHTGGIDGFASVFGYETNDKIGFAVTSNGVNMNINDISIILLTAAYGHDFSIPDFKTVKVDASILKQYEGLYKSIQMPLDVTIFVENGVLMAQASGQSAFPLDAVSETNFKFDMAGVEIIFNAKEGTMTMKQSGMSFQYKKQ